jgi:hypothetical protein
MRRPAKRAQGQVRGIETSPISQPLPTRCHTRPISQLLQHAVIPDRYRSSSQHAVIPTERSDEGIRGCFWEFKVAKLPSRRQITRNARNHALLRKLCSTCTDLHLRETGPEMISIWPFNKGTLKPDRLPLNGPWTVFEGQHDGRIMFVRTNTAYREYGSVAGYEHQVGIAGRSRMR